MPKGVPDVPVPPQIDHDRYVLHPAHQAHGQVPYQMLLGKEDLEASQSALITTIISNYTGKQ